MPTARRTTIISEETKDHFSKGRPRLWGFSYTDFAKLFHMNENALRQAVFKGRVDLADLESVCMFWFRRRQLHPVVPELPTSPQ